MNEKKGGTDRTALMLATRSLEVINALIEHGADVKGKDNSGKTVLMHAAAYNRNPDVIRALVDSGADVNMRDKDSWTPLMRACGNPNPEVMEALMEKGADINAKDDFGKTVLDYARSGKRDDLVQLLETGVLPTRVDIRPILAKIVEYLADTAAPGTPLNEIPNFKFDSGGKVLIDGITDSGEITCNADTRSWKIKSVQIYIARSFYGSQGFRGQDVIDMLETAMKSMEIDRRGKRFEPRPDAVRYDGLLSRFGIPYLLEEMQDGDKGVMIGSMSFYAGV